MSYDAWKTNAPDPGTVEEPDERHDCDETCSGCPQCYIRTGATVCDRLCEHADEARARLLDLEMVD